MNTMVTLAGSAKGAMDALPEAVQTFSDGYTMKIETTLGASMDASAETSACLQSEGGNAVCHGAYAGDDEGQLATMGAAWIAAADWNIEGMPLTVANAVTAEAHGAVSSPVKAKADEDSDAVYPDAAVASGAVISTMWYQPKAAKVYAGLPRFEAGAKINAFASFGEGVDKDGSTVWPKTACGEFELTGASAIVAGAAVAFSVVALL